MSDMVPLCPELVQWERALAREVVELIKLISTGIMWVGIILLEQHFCCRNANRIIF